jgi:hypothetical protein
MIRILPRSQGNVVGIECIGKISREDYTSTVIPAIDRAIAQHGKARVLVEFADSFSGYDIKALFEDARYGGKHLRDFERCAVINGPLFVKMAFKLMNKVTKCECRSFDKSDRDKAWNFIEG